MSGNGNIIFVPGLWLFTNLLMDQYDNMIVLFWHVEEKSDASGSADGQLVPSKRPGETTHPKVSKLRRLGRFDPEQVESTETKEAETTKPEGITKDSKYGLLDTPSFVSQVCANVAVEEPPVYNTQGEDIGRKRGRKPTAKNGEKGGVVGKKTGKGKGKKNGKGGKKGKRVAKGKKVKNGAKKGQRIGAFKKLAMTSPPRKTGEYAVKPPSKRSLKPAKPTPPAEPAPPTIPKMMIQPKKMVNNRDLCIMEIGEFPLVMSSTMAFTARPTARTWSMGLTLLVQQGSWLGTLGGNLGMLMTCAGRSGKPQGPRRTTRMMIPQSERWGPYVWAKVCYIDTLFDLHARTWFADVSINKDSFKNNL